MNAAEVDPNRGDHEVHVRRESFPPNASPPRRVSAAPIMSACVGREPELAKLRAHHAAASEGQILGVCLEGPAGVGKSRIVAEFKARVRLEGGVVLDGTSDHGGPYGGFAGVVSDALRFLRDLGREPSFDVGDLRCVGGCHRFWHEHQGPIVEGRPPAESRARFFAAIGALIRDVGTVRAPVVLLRDLDRADSGTLGLFEDLLIATPLADLDCAGGALFIATIDGAPEGRVAELANRPEMRRMSVGNLDAEGVREMLASPAIVERVLAVTGGAPEAIERLLQTSPVTRETWLAHRMEAASRRARSLIEALAAFGAPADLDTLARIAEVDLDAETSREFASLEFLTSSVAEGLRQFRFAHDIARDKIYGALEPAVRVALHERSISVCSTDPVRACRHAVSAGEGDRAAPLALEAARSLSAQHAQVEAAALLEQVLALHPAASAELHDFLAELYRAVGSYKYAIAHLKALRVCSPSDPVLARRVGEILTLAGELEKATAVLEEARALCLSSADRASLPEIDAMIAELLYQRGLYEDAAQWAERARASREDVSISVAIRARNVLGKIAFSKDVASAEVIFRENIAAASEAQLGNEEAGAWINVGIARLRAHDLAAAQEAYARAFELGRKHSDTYRMALAVENLAVLHHVQRDYAHAQSRYQEALALWRKVGNKAYLARLSINLGELYESLGDLTRARALLHLAVQSGASSLTRRHEAEALALQGRIELSAGDTASARAALQAALEIWQELSPVCADAVLFSLARTALADGDVSAARVWLAEANTSDSPKSRATHAILRAEIARSLGEPTTDLAVEARAAAEQTGDDELRLWSELVLSQALLDEDAIDAALARLQTTLSIENRLETHVPRECLGAFGARPMRRRLESLRSELTARGRDRLRVSSSPARPSEMPRARSEYPEILGDSSAIRRVLTMLDKVGPSDCLVLVRGESGTGKELIADALHRNSRRRDKPIVKVNCAALVETLLLSELFGHERGAFTGANARRRGRFELADGGTLFLDEIGDISPKTQVALLRVLQEREFERVGGTQPVRVDVRIVAATHRDLEQMVREGTFREDLYYRLRGVSIEMPALRNRLEDLPALVEGLLARIAEERSETPKRLSPDALRVLAAHRWPGNIRELENVLRSASLFAEGTALEVSDFQELSHLDPVEIPSISGPSREDEVVDKAFARIRGGAVSLFDMKKEIERECIVRALQETQGNITHAATLLGMKRPRLSQLVKEYGLQTNGALS